MPPNLKGGAPQRVAAKLIAEGLAKEIKAKADAPIWRRDAKSEQAYSLKLSAAGAKAVTLGEGASEKLEPASSTQEPLTDPKDSSEASSKAAEVETAVPRPGSKLASVMTLLARSEGATIDVLTKATGWLPHTTRAAITGVRRRGYSVILDRSVEGASVYRLSNPQGSEVMVSAPKTVEEKKLARRRETKAKAAA